VIHPSDRPRVFSVAESPRTGVTDAPADSGDGPGDAFVTALVENQRGIYAFIATLLPQPSDVEDVYQQTCLALWKKRDRASTICGRRASGCSGNSYHRGEPHLLH